MIGSFYVYLGHRRKNIGLLTPRLEDIEDIKEKMDCIHQEKVRLAAIEGSLDAHTKQILSITGTTEPEELRGSYFEVGSSFVVGIHHNEQIIRENWSIKDSTPPDTCV